MLISTPLRIVTVWVALQAAEYKCRDI